MEISKVLSDTITENTFKNYTFGVFVLKKFQLYVTNLQYLFGANIFHFFQIKKYYKFIFYYIKNDKKTRFNIRSREIRNRNH